MNTSPRYLALSLEVFLLFIGLTVSGQNTKPLWVNNTLFNRNVFIENKGQFFEEEKADVGKTILYSSRKGKIHLYFSSSALTFRYDSIIPGESLKENEDEDKGGKPGEANFTSQHEFMSVTWDGANPDVQVEPEDLVNDYFTYGDPSDKSGHTSIKARGWQRLVYHNLYPNIDVVYYFPSKGGIEYDIIVRPGGDLSKVKMHYSNNAALSLLKSNVHIVSPCGTFTDHAPVAETDDKSNVAMQFSVQDNTISFIAGNYDKTKTLTIDPWIYTTAFTTVNKAYYIAYDLQGNLYAYGGYYPYQEIKVNSGGTLVWTYTSTFTYTYSAGFSFLGGFCVDGYTGKGFMSEGFDITNGSQILSVNSAGAQLSLLNGLASYDEIWELRFNNCTKKGVMIGGGTASPSMQTAVLDTNNVTLAPVQTYVTGHMDLSVLTTDNTGNCYILSSQNAAAPPTMLIKAPIASLTTPAYNVASPYGFSEIMAAFYVPGTLGYAGANGFNGMATSSKYIYSWDGSVLRRWSQATGAIIASLTINPTPYLSGGITADECDHVFVGSNKSVIEYDSTFHLLNTYNLPDTVYDVLMGPGNTITDNVLYAGGLGFLTAVHIQRVTAVTTPTGTCSCSGTATANSCGIGPFTYSWSNGQTTQTASNLCAGSYTVTITDNGPCIPTVDTAIVNISGGGGGFTVTSVIQQPKCFGNTNGKISLTPKGIAPYTYQWSTGATASIDSNLAPGTYTCIVTESGGCTDTLKLTITAPTAVTLTTAFVPDTCGKVDGSATVTANGGTAPYIYKWNTGVTSSSLSPIGAGTYTVTVKDSNNCPDSAVVTVSTAIGSFPVTSAIQKPKCFGDKDGVIALTPKGNPPYSYQWSSGSTAATDSNLAPGTYTCVITESGGCTDTVKITLTQPTAINLTTTFIPDTCGKVDGGATVTATGGIAPYVYKWSTGVTSSSASPLGAGTYTVVVKDSNSCPDSAIVTVTPVGGNISVGFVADTLNGCYPVTISFTDTAKNTAPPVVSWTWDFGDGKDTTTTTATVIHTYLTPGSYTVKLTATTTGGCFGVDSILNFITVYAHPHANFTFSPQPATLLNPNIQFTDLTTDPYPLKNWFWTFGDGIGTSTKENPSYAYADTGTYCPELVVADIHNCMDSITECLEISPYFTLYIPNAFTPNNDGLNDVFAPKGVGIVTFEMWIFDRWGQKLYHTTNIYQGWNGTVQGGIGGLCQEDTYVYLIDITDINSVAHTYMGRVSIIK